jgi:hypothetical protein
MKSVCLALALVIILSTACITIVQPGATAPGGTTPGVQKPAAFIDRISPSSLNWGEPVNFIGHGTAASGTITAYLWRSSIDGDLGSGANFSTTQLSPGNHIVLFSVQDSSGNWSLETQGTVNVITEAAAEPPPADPGTPPPADPGSGAPVVTPPVINSFNAAPAGIAAGATSTLSWDVSNAVAVTINQGVGSVGLTGTRAVSPAVTTTYTLTAANTAYFGQATVTVTVAAAVAPRPDLIIEDIWKVGDKMYYRIKNQGTAASPVTWSEVKVDGTVKAQDAVAALAAGAATTRSFAGYVYSCSGISDSVVVTADTTNVAMESNGANNSKTKTFNCLGPVGPLGPLVPVPLEPLGPAVVVLKPDLVITEIIHIGGMIDLVNYTVKNVGTKNAGAFDVKLYVNGVLKATDHVDALNAGSQVQSAFSGYHGGCAAGVHSTIVKVVADSGAAVTESDETNNSRTELWGCPW